MEITKASGLKEEFSKTKFLGSLKRAGLRQPFLAKVYQGVAKKIRPGIGTAEILNQTYHRLCQENPILAARYNLKKAIMELGPTGFTFEKYVAEILKEYGYNVKTGETVKGYCVNHEIDVIAQKDLLKYSLGDLVRLTGFRPNIVAKLQTQARALCL